MTLTSGTPPHVPATTTPKWQDAGGGRRSRMVGPGPVRSNARGYLGSVAKTG